MIGYQYNENNIYQSIGAGINAMGIQLILAYRLDRNHDNLSILFEIGFKNE